MVSQVIGWGLSLVITIFLPRYLGAENYGKLSLAGSLWIIVVNFATFGMDTYLTREIARDRNKLDLLLSQSLLLRLILFIFGAILLIVYLMFTDYSPETYQVIAILAISNFNTLICGGFIATVQALERMEILAYSSILGNVLSTVFLFIAMFLGFGLNAFAWIISVVPSIILLFYMTYSLLRLHPFKFRPSTEDLRGFLTASFSFFLLYILISLYHQSDTVIISLLVDERGVGLYSAADKLLASIFFIPNIFMTVLFPTFSRLSKEDADKLSKLFRKAIHMMIWLGTAFGLGTLIISDQIVRLIYGSEYINSGPILALKAVVTAGTFCNIILGIYFMSIDRQKSWLFVLAMGTVSQIPLNIIFVPLFDRYLGNGAMGAALSCVITEAGMTIAGIFMLPKQILDRTTVSYFIRTMLAGGCMVAGSWWLRDSFIAIPIIVGAAIFILISYVLKLLSGEEWQLLYETITKATSRIRSKLRNTAS